MFRLLTAREIECRVAQVKAKGLSLLLYKDARVDMNILDETFGPLNWQRRHTRDNANCIVSIWDDSKKCWVEKEDTGTESNTEAEKGLASDSFKRACFNVGIGRELYSAPFIWVTPPDCTITSDNGKYKCFDRFEVREIGYDEHREINHLVIVNEKTGNVAFKFDGPAEKPDAEALMPEDTPKMATPAQRETILGMGTAEQLAKLRKRYGQDLEKMPMVDCGKVLQWLKGGQ